MGHSNTFGYNRVGGDCMAFYDVLGQYYDILFPANEKQLHFLTKNLNDDSSILDIGCATGTYAIPMARSGYRVTAFDLDDNMIQKLLEKAAVTALDIRAFDLSMLDLAKLTQEQYHMIYCIGNTIVHLETFDEVTSVLKECKRLLLPHGEMILQIVNYDRIVKENITELPEIIRPKEELEFRRTYELKEDHVIFSGQLKLGPNIVMEESSPLLCLTKEALEACFHSAGFSKIEFYGDFDESGWSIDSPAIIVRAK